MSPTPTPTRPTRAASSRPPATIPPARTGVLSIQPGNRLPGIPAHLGKLGLTYNVTDAWIISAAGIVRSGSYLFGDAANLTPTLPPFFTLNLSTSYQVTPHIQLFAMVDNVTNARYYTFGTFSPTSSVFLAQAPNATNPRAYSIAAPEAGFGGIRVTF